MAAAEKQANATAVPTNALTRRLKENKIVRQSEKLLYIPNSELNRSTSHEYISGKENKLKSQKLNILI